MKNSLEHDIIGVDYGEVRIGVARINPIVGIAEPLTVLSHISETKVFEALEEIRRQYNADRYVVGLPRGLDGQDTAQTAVCRQFALLLRSTTKVDVYVIDEAGTTEQAKIRQRPGQAIDAVAAGILLEDYVHHPHPEGLRVEEDM